MLLLLLLSLKPRERRGGGGRIRHHPLQILERGPPPLVASSPLASPRLTLTGRRGHHLPPHFASGEDHRSPFPSSILHYTLKYNNPATNPLSPCLPATEYYYTRMNARRGCQMSEAVCSGMKKKAFYYLLQLTTTKTTTTRGISIAQPSLALRQMSSQPRADAQRITTTTTTTVLSTTNTFQKTEVCCIRYS